MPLRISVRPPAPAISGGYSYHAIPAGSQVYLVRVRVWMTSLLVELCGFQVISR
jgi:hypothetical protein